MHDLKEKVAELSEKFDKLKASFQLADKKGNLAKLEAKTTDPSLWKNQGQARNLLREFADLKSEIDEMETIEKQLTDLNELAKDASLAAELEKEISGLAKKIDKLTLKTFLSGQYDAKNALVAIHAGQGGTEAMDWANMLLRMYLRYCEIKGWKTGLIDISAGEEAGIKSATLKVEGKYAYGYLQPESGTHRLVRQSPFNADNLRQTSFALVEVLPELEEIDLPDISIKEEDLDWQFFRASSQGGQNVQKVSSAVRLTHKPTKIVVTAQAERFQEQNRKNALNLLRAKLWMLEKEKEAKTKEKIKGEYRPASWGTQIRSYVLHPYKMVKDLRTGVEEANPEAVLDGEIEEFIEAGLRLTIDY
jgi:peptide chain release factor 2